jgi:hypothetical protein
MKNIAVAGQIASGKDLLSDHLENKLSFEDKEREWDRIAFGDGLKKVFMDAFNENLSFIEKWKRDPEPPPGYSKTVRQALQSIGDDFRQIHPKVWVNLVFRNDKPKIITDVRYVNEAQAVKNHGGINILLWRPGHENYIDHPSEAQIFPYIYYFSECEKEGVIEDDWGTMDLYMKFMELFKTLNLPFSEDVTPKSLFDIFLINNGTPEDLFNKIDLYLEEYNERQK